MITRITLSIADPEQLKGTSQIDLRDEFETVLDLLVPLTQVSSALEQRSRSVLNKADGGRILIRPEHIVWVEEVDEKAS